MHHEAEPQEAEPQGDSIEARVLDRLRVELQGFSYAAVGAKIGISDETVRRHLRPGGTTRPTCRFVMRVCVAYDLSPQWVLFGVGEKRWSRTDDSVLDRAPLSMLLEHVSDRVRGAERRLMIPVPVVRRDVASRVLELSREMDVRADHPADGGG